MDEPSLSIPQTKTRKLKIKWLNGRWYVVDHDHITFNDIREAWKYLEWHFKDQGLRRKLI